MDSKEFLGFVERGDYQAVESALELPDIRRFVKKSCTPAFYAVSGADDTILRLLIASGASVNGKALSPLILAIVRGYGTMVKTLLEAGADIDQADFSKDTPLITAVAYQNEEDVDRLLDAGADVNRVGARGYTALHVAVASDSVVLTNKLLQRNANPLAVNSKGDTLLDTCYRRASYRVKDIVLDLGLDFESSNVAHTPSRKRALLWFEKQADLLKYIHELDFSMTLKQIEKGANANARYSDGDTVLYKACRAGAVEVARALMDHGANVNAKVNSGETALIVASRCGFVEIVHALIEHGADVNAKSYSGNTALMTANITGSIEITQALIDHGADVNARDDHQNTALLNASAWGHLPCVLLLLRAGARIENNGAGSNALTAAQKNGYGEIVSALNERIIF